jgi:transglutaminase-like putative cysteine protease
MNACEAPAWIDEQRIAWAQVTRAYVHVHQRFHYVYPGPIRALRQRLVVIPAARYGTQRLCSHRLTATPMPDTSRSTTDAFGNHVVEMEVPAPGASVAFEVVLTIEHDARRPGEAWCPADAARRFLAPTQLTAPDAFMTQMARQLRAHGYAPAELAQRVAEWVANTMRYEAGVTTVQTTAAEALALRRGLCQDYAHVMIALCRAAGVAARYVSGHLLGEGGSHAWVEVLLPQREGYGAQAYDPTNGRRRHLGYITIAVGRDYRDVAPVSGVYIAPYPGQLSWSKQARITRLEFANGDTVGYDRACEP